MLNTNNLKSIKDVTYKSVIYSKLTEEIRIETDAQIETEYSDTSILESRQEYSADDAIEAIGFGFLQIRLSVFASLVWMADAMEMMLLAVLGPAVSCKWNLTTPQEAFISTVVFLGSMFGAPIWGMLSDRYGRKRILFFSTLSIVYFGILTSIVPNYVWLLVVRSIVGFFISASGLTVTYYSEFLPTVFRSPCIVLLEFAWAGGSCLEALLAFIVMPTLGWRYLVAFSAIPCIISLLYFPFVPMSPRYLLSINKIEDAEKVLKKCAKQNCKKVPDGVLVVMKTKNSNSNTNTDDNNNNNNNNDNNNNNSDNNNDNVSNDDDMNNANDNDSQNKNCRNKNISILNDDNNNNKKKKKNKNNKNSNNDTTTTTTATTTTTTTSTTTNNNNNSSSSSSNNNNNDHIAEYSEDGFKVSKSLKNNSLEMFSRRYRITTIYMLFISFVNGFAYYGAVLVSTVLFVYDHHCDASGITSPFNTSSPCVELTSSDYKQFLIASAAEFPGIILTLFLSDLLGRKLTLFSEYNIAAIGYLLLFLCLGSSDRLYKLIFLFLTRASITGAYQAAIVYLPEVYPTRIRGTAAGACSLCSRIGALVTPFVAQVLLKSNFVTAVLIYSGFLFAASLISLLLPVETRCLKFEEVEKEFKAKENSKYGYIGQCIPSFHLFLLCKKFKQLLH